MRQVATRQNLCLVTMRAFPSDKEEKVEESIAARALAALERAQVHPATEVLTLPGRTTLVQAHTVETRSDVCVRSSIGHGKGLVLLNISAGAISKR